MPYALVEELTAIPVEQITKALPLLGLSASQTKLHAHYPREVKAIPSLLITHPVPFFVVTYGMKKT